MKIPMTFDILSVILAVQAHHKFLHADRFARLSEQYVPIDYDKENFVYYCSLPLPDRLTKSWGCFSSVFRYNVTDKIMNTQEEDLPRLFTFEY